MSIALRSFAKINLGLKIGPLRADGFHELRTIYQTIALHDVVRVEVAPGEGIEIRCADARVPCDATNTCWKVAERVLNLIGGFSRVLKSAREKNGESVGSPVESKGAASGAVKRIGDADSRAEAEARDAGEKADGLDAGLKASSTRIIITIEKHLPVQGGMGAASSNAVAAMLGLERALGVELTQHDKLRIAAEVGSDLPLFVIGGTVLGVARGQEVCALPDIPETALVIVTPPVGVSTPKAFAQWDALMAVSSRTEVREEKSKTGGLDAGPSTSSGQALKASSIGTSFESAESASQENVGALTAPKAAGTMKEPNQTDSAWLSERLLSRAVPAKEPASGVPAVGGDRAETPLLDLVRTGIENDFERVVFPEYPELREVKSVLQREGARYASLSGSGSTLYGMFASSHEAEAAAERMRAAGHAAVATRTVGRAEYWARQLVTRDS